MGLNKEKCSHLKYKDPRYEWEEVELVDILQCAWIQILAVCLSL